MNPKDYDVVVVGASAGGLAAITELFSRLPKKLDMAVIVVQHVHKDSPQSHLQYLNEHTCMAVREAGDKERIEKGTIYFAPPDYHLLVEPEGVFSLSVDEKVQFARPSIDVLFESAAIAYGERLIGIIMTGGNSDGAEGLRCVHNNGGLTIVQDPATAEMPYMPKAALQRVDVEYLLAVPEIAKLLYSGDRDE